MHTFLEEINRQASAIAPIFYEVLYMSITAACIGLIILLLRGIADKHIAPVWKYTLWLLVLVALLVPYRPQSGLALLPESLQFGDISYGTQYDNIDNAKGANSQNDHPTSDALSRIDTLENQQQTLDAKSFILDTALPLIWLLGMSAIGLFFIVGRIKLSRHITRHTKSSNARFDRLLNECKDTLGIRSSIKVAHQDYIASPALIGIFKAKIILPDYADQLGEDSLRYIFLHELSHFKRKDMLLNSLLLMLQTVYWFNPIIWVLFKNFREDMELLNDAYVLKHIGTENKKTYALSLVDILGRSQRLHMTPKLLCMVDGKGNLERRISMLKLGDLFKKHKIVIAALCLVLIGTPGALFLTQMKTFTTYENEKFTLQYPKSWIAIDEDLSPEEINAVYEKTGFDQEWIDQNLQSNSIQVILMDPAHGADGHAALLYISTPGKILPDFKDVALVWLKNINIDALGHLDDFAFLDEPYIKEMGSNEFYICSVHINGSSMYQALVNGKYSTYQFMYNPGSDSIDDETEKVVEQILSSFKLTE